MHEEHFARLTRLLKQERIEDRKQYEQKIRNRSITDRRKEGACWYPVSIIDSHLSTGERWALKVERTQDQGSRHMFQVGASVSLFLFADKITKSVSGVVSRMGDNTMRIVLNRDDPPHWLDDGKLGVDLLFDESTYDEMEKTMKILQHAKEKRTLELIEVLLGTKKPVFTSEYPINFPGLNDSQNKAIQHIASAEDVALVHGPPGTGKTTTLVSAILATLDKEQQVLVCTASNSAVDLLVERLHQQGVNVLRLGHPGRVDEEVVSRTLDVQLTEHPDARMLKELRKKSEEMKKMGFKYKRNFGKDERLQRKMLLDESRKIKEDALALEDHMIHQLLSDAQVIACTLIGANSDYLRKKTFKTLFIDEASQALEPASWVPIMKTHRVVLAGDHQQLPPTVKSKEAASGGLSETIFERCMKQVEENVMLNVQYRMHPDIAAFSNKYFYGNGILNDTLVDNRHQLFPKPISFLDTAGCGFNEEVNPETLSTFNTEQGVFLLRFLDQLLQELPEMAQCSIGVIAPYRAQVDVLRKNIRSYDWFSEMTDKITIHSVDAFQGQERDVILIDLVRSNDRGEVGFLSDIRRINVALTRARQRLVVVGDSATLSHHPFYDELIQFFQQREFYHSAFEYLY